MYVGGEGGERADVEQQVETRYGRKEGLCGLCER